MYSKVYKMFIQTLRQSKVMYSYFICDWNDHTSTKGNATVYNIDFQILEKIKKFPTDKSYPVLM